MCKPSIERSDVQIRIIFSSLLSFYDAGGFMICQILFFEFFNYAAVNQKKKKEYNF